MDKSIKNDITIPGLSSVSALDRLMDNRKLYLDLLRRFPESCKPYSPEKIRKALVLKDFETAGIYAHSLRNICGNIGADELSCQLQTLETGIRNGKPDGLEEILDFCCLNLGRILDGIAAFIKQEGGPVPSGKSHNRVQKLNDTLLRMLEESDTEAEVYIDDNISLLAEEYPDYFPSLRTALRNYDFDEASAIFSAALTGR